MKKKLRKERKDRLKILSEIQDKDGTLLVKSQTASLACGKKLWKECEEGTLKMFM